MEPVVPPKIAASQAAATALVGMSGMLDGRTREVGNLVRNKVLR